MRRGGGEIWDIEMSRALNKMGHNITLYTGKPLSGDISKPSDLPTIKVTSPFLYDLGYAAPIGVGGLITDIDRQLFITQLRRHLADNYDIVQINGCPETLRIRNSVECPMTIKLNGPPHSLFYDYIHPTKSSYSWLNQADGIVTNQITAKKIRAETDINPTVLPPGVDTNRFTPKENSTERPNPSILWVGRYVPVKNLSELLDGFNNLRERGINAELVLVGEGPLQSKIKKRAKSYDLKDSIRFEGYIPNNKLPTYYSEADIFALSSHHESFGMVLLEAMACGTPVVAPRIDYIPEIVTDGQAGLLYEPGSPGDLSDKLRQLLEDPKRRNEMSQYARKTVTSQFKWEQQAKKLLDYYERIIQ
ncbi:glycosyltransferase family 4 protein [Halobellus rubicundus]|uniref:Glycosyltransferase family 4 protein n=1 Tax=Halobellus rubicundus TaxID=2996466 RepID=A0ABD5MHH7_9EURY